MHRIRRFLAWVLDGHLFCVLVASFVLVAGLTVALNEGTASQHGRALDEFVTWYAQTYAEEPDPVLLTDEEVREWRSYLSGVRKQAASTVNAKLAAIKGLARHSGNEISVQGVRRVQQPIEPLTGRDLGRLVRAVRAREWGAPWITLRNVALIALMGRAGLRVGEVVALDVADVELNERSGWAQIRRGKGLKERRVPLSLEARKALAAYVEVRPEWAGVPLFVTKTGKRMSARSVQRMVASAAHRAGLADVTPHTLRHTFSTRFLRRGGDLATPREILGHANLATTSRYLHRDGAQVQAMVEDL